MLFPVSTSPSPVSWLSTGWPALDTAIGGGVPTGRITEAFGREDLARRMVHAVAWGAARSGLPVVLARSIEEMNELCGSRSADAATSPTVFVMDVSRLEWLDCNGPEHVLAVYRDRLWARFLRSVTPRVYEGGHTLLVVGPRRDPSRRFDELGFVGPVECCRALRFYASVRVDFRAERAVIVKNKLAPPHERVSYPKGFRR